MAVHVYGRVCRACFVPPLKGAMCGETKRKRFLWCNVMIMNMGEGGRLRPHVQRVLPLSIHMRKPTNTPLNRTHLSWR